MQKQDSTTIRVSNEVRDQLKDLGKKGQTYDEIIKKLIDEFLLARGRNNEDPD